MRITIKLIRHSETLTVPCRIIEGGRLVELAPEEMFPAIDPRACACPTCDGMYAYRSGVFPAVGDIPPNTGTVRGLSARLGALQAHREELTREWGPLELEEPPRRPARVILPRPQEYSHGYTGTARSASAAAPRSGRW